MHINSVELEKHTWEEDQAVNTEAFPVLLGHFPTHDQRDSSKRSTNELQK